MTEAGSDTGPKLSAVMVAGPLRERAERTLAGLARQTVSSEIEVVVVDTAPAERELRLPDGVAIVPVSADGAGRGEDRALGVRAARAPIVALIEDHAVPAPSWAEALIGAHARGWKVVGYAFAQPEPSNYFSRAALVSEAGPWMHPARRRRVSSLPSSNVSLDRELLLSLTDDDESFLLYDHVLCGQVERRGHEMLLEPGAVVAHEYFPRLMPLLLVNFGHGRLLGTARSRGWSRRRRALWALGTPLSAPLVRAGRLLRSISGPAGVVRALRYAPVLIGSYLAEGLGEALGIAFGAGPWPERMERYELELPRLEPATTASERAA